MKSPVPKLPLTPEEKNNLRASKVKTSEIARMDVPGLSRCLQSDAGRARYLRGLAQFQSVPSIGPKIAERIVQMGYYSLGDVKNMTGAELIDRWERHCGYWEDPCLEDAFRCIVHHANDPESGRSWHDFTDERKNYRERHGYPADRPAVPWHEKFGKRSGRPERF